MANDVNQKKHGPYESDPVGELLDSAYADSDAPPPFFEEALQTMKLETPPDARCSRCGGEYRHHQHGPDDDAVAHPHAFRSQLRPGEEWDWPDGRWDA